MKGYIIATVMDECYGHGDNGKVLAMKQEDAYHTQGWFPPVFLNRETAEDYLTHMEWPYKKQIEEVTIIGGKDGQIKSTI